MDKTRPAQGQKQDMGRSQDMGRVPPRQRKDSTMYWYFAGMAVTLGLALAIALVHALWT